MVLTLFTHACRPLTVPVPAPKNHLSEEPAQQLMEPCETLPTEPVVPFLEPCSLSSKEPAQRTQQACNILLEESAEHFLEPCSLMSEEPAEQTLHPCSFMSRQEPRVLTAAIPSFCLHKRLQASCTLHMYMFVLPASLAECLALVNCRIARCSADFKRHALSNEQPSNSKSLGCSQSICSPVLLTHAGEA